MVKMLNIKWNVFIDWKIGKTRVEQENNPVKLGKTPKKLFFTVGEEVPDASEMVRHEEAPGDAQGVGAVGVAAPRPEVKAGVDDVCRERRRHSTAA